MIIPIKTPKALNRLLLAQQSVRRALALFPFIEKQKGDNAKSALYSAFCTFYARPFTNSHGVGPLLEEEVVEAAHIHTHKKVMAFRHTAAAHTDSRLTLDDEQVHCAYFECSEEGISIIHHYPYPTAILSKEIIDLVTTLDATLSESIDECLSNGPPSKMKFEKGRYKLNLENGNGWFFKLDEA